MSEQADSSNLISGEPQDSERDDSVAQGADGRVHFLSFALEEYYHATAFRRRIAERHARRLESRLDHSVDEILARLNEHGGRATFFALGSLAESRPDVLRRIADGGHEIAARTWEHRQLAEFDHDSFRRSVRESRDSLEQVVGQPVVGFRIPEGRIKPSEMWVLDLLADEGFAYDSSMYPMLWELGSETWMRFPFVHDAGERRIMEFPLSTWGPDGLLLPISGGNAMRQLPGRAGRFAVSDWSRRYESPFNLYFNVWEFDLDAPRLSVGGRLTKLRQYRNLDHAGDLLDRFMDRYQFGPISAALDQNVVPRSRPFRDAVPGNIPLPGDSDHQDTSAPVINAVLSQDDLSVVIPCYNESDAVGYLAEALTELETAMSPQGLRFIFVDDGSRDDTVHRLEDIFGDRPNCRVIAHVRNRGVSAAIMTGIQAAETDLVASMDCDCTYDPMLFGQMLPLMEKDVALVTGSPYHPNGTVRNVPGWRLFLSKGLSAVYRRLLRNKLHTYTSCFRIYRRSLVAPIDLKSGGFLGVAELVTELDRRGHRIVECPAMLESRLLGTSKMKTLRTILQHLQLIRRLAWQKISGQATVEATQSVATG